MKNRVNMLHGLNSPWGICCLNHNKFTTTLGEFRPFSSSPKSLTGQQWNPNLLKGYASALGILSVIFLWNFQISFGGIGMPIYFLIIPFSLVLSMKKEDVVLSFILALLFITLTIAQFLQDIAFIKPSRTLAGIFAFSLLLVVVFRWIRVSLGNRLILFHTLLMMFLKVQFAVQLLQLLLWSVSYYQPHYISIFGAPLVSGLFSEPSHVAVSMAPLVYWFICHTQWFNTQFGDSGKLWLIGIALLSACTTWLGIFSAAVIIRWLCSFGSFSRFVRLFPGILMFGGLFFYSVTHVEGVASRLSSLFLLMGGTIDASANISSLVFVKGFQMAWEGIKSFPFGVGLLNFGYLNALSEVSSFSDLLYELNADDGSSLAFKMVGEFGYLGVIIIIASILGILRRTVKGGVRDIFYGGFMFGLLASYIRGMSYFDGVALLGLSVLVVRWMNLVVWQYQPFVPKEQKTV